MNARWTEQRPVRIFWPRLSVRGILDKLVAADAAYRQRLTLESLDDRMLRDVGISRADIARETRALPRW